MTHPEQKRCPLCLVTIQSQPEQPDTVQFSSGPAGTRSKLWSRVCQFVRDPEKQTQCINQNPDERGLEQQGDAFPDPPMINAGEPTQNL